MDRIVDQCIQRLCANKDPEILCIKMQSLIQHEYKNRGIVSQNRPILTLCMFLCIYTFNRIFAFVEFIINKVNEENDRKLRPLLNDILDNVADLTGYKMNTYHQKIIQYIIVCNYMGDPTSPILVQEISGYYYSEYFSNCWKYKELGRGLLAPLNKKISQFLVLSAYITYRKKWCRGPRKEI